ncbi:MAG: hypothetical protein UHZ01_00145, partial [Prevotella sp.]|nr:hypothetical protein [Prevotella sp.]
MNKNVFMIALVAGTMVMSSCVSKKELENCQAKGKELMAKYGKLNTECQDAKEQLAAAKARVTSLEEQLAQQKKDYSALQGALDKSLTNASQNNISIDKLVDQINESNQY